MAKHEPGTYLEFINPVPFSGAEGPVERGVLNDAGRISGRAQSAVREISAADFNRIISVGLAEATPILPRETIVEEPAMLRDVREPFIFQDEERTRIDHFSSRIVRNRVFRRLVLRAYDERCAITGLKLINGGGRAEVQAAHIRPVEANGPDTINNGLALSGTAHWMFDRGLISLSDELEILVHDKRTILTAFMPLSTEANALCFPDDRQTGLIHIF